MGCFWGAERKFWTVEGVVVTSTAVGYGAGATPCTGRCLPQAEPQEPDGIDVSHP